MKRRLSIFVDVGTTCAALISAGALMWLAVGARTAPTSVPIVPRSSTARPSGAPPKPFSIAGLRTRGADVASVGLVEYADFECPYCRKFETSTMPALRKAYIDSGKVLFVFRHLPLPGVHPHAEAAAQAAECGASQGRFWEMHDGLMALEVPALDSQGLQDLAGRAGLNKVTFSSCLSGQPSSVLEADVKSAQDAGISGTPTFILGSLRDGVLTPVVSISGSRPIADFVREIDALLAKNQGGA